MAASAYMSEQLGIDTAARFDILSMDVNKQWNWKRGAKLGCL